MARQRSTAFVAVLTAALALAATLVLSACGSSSSNSSRTSSPAPASSGAAATGTSTSAAPPSSGSSAGAVTNYAQYVGGHGAANPKLSPVTIGFLNQQGGPPSESFPQATAAAQAVVKMINAELGGVHGHPVKLAPCFIATASAQALSCAQQMLAAKGVEAIVDGLVTIGNSSIYTALHGSIPVVIGVSASPADDAGKNVFELEGSSLSAGGPFATFVKQAYPHAHTLAIAYQNQVGTAAIAQGLKAAFQKVGLAVKLLPYSPSTTDLTGPATQMEQADIASPLCGFVDCPLMARAVAEIHGTKPAISTPLWTYLPPPAYGGDLPHWIVGTGTANLDYTGDPGVVAFRAQSARYGLPAADTLNIFAAFAWQGILLADKVMNRIPFAKLSASAVTAGIRAYKGPIPLGPPNIDCSGTVDPAVPGVCSEEGHFFMYEGHGQWKQLSGWLGPPK